jgi:hypothetical protein
MLGEFFVAPRLQNMVIAIVCHESCAVFFDPHVVVPSEPDLDSGLLADARAQQILG